MTKSNLHNLEGFKRAVSSTVRALANDAEIEVSFGTAPTPTQGQLRLPMVYSDMSKQEIADIIDHFRIDLLHLLGGESLQ